MASLLHTVRQRLQEIAADLSELHRDRRRREGAARAAFRLAGDLASIAAQIVVAALRGVAREGDGLVRDLRYSCRRLSRAPLFSFTAVGVLAIGLGATTAMFSLINAALFAPLPVPAPDTLVFVYSEPIDSVVYTPIVSDDVAQLAMRTDVFDALATAGTDASWTTIEGRTERLTGAVVSRNYFQTLGIAPVIGRDFAPDDDQAAASPVVVISHDIWMSRFSAAPSVIGRTIHLRGQEVLTDEQGRDYTIIGVAPAGFRGTGSQASWNGASYYALFSQRQVDLACPAHDHQARSSERGVIGIGRLRPGVAASSAQRAVDVWSRSLKWAIADRPLVVRVTATRHASLPAEIAGAATPDAVAVVLMLLGAMVMGIAVSNLVGLLMARSVTRSGESAVRLSLGASRWQVARQHFIESGLLAGAGTAGGLMFAKAIVAALVANLPDRLGSVSVLGLTVPLDGRVFAFAVIAGAVSCLLVGVAPARLAARTNVLSSLQCNAGDAHRPRTMRYWIVVPQIAACMALLVVSATTTASLVASETMAPGYDGDHVAVVDFAIAAPDECVVRTPAQASASYTNWRARSDAARDRLLTGVRRLTSVQAATLSSRLPLEMRMGGAIVTPERVAAGGAVGVATQYVWPGYFAAMKIQLLAGRDFTERETLTSASGGASAIVSRQLAERLWPGQSPLGRALSRYDSTHPSRLQWATVVGVAENVLPPIHDGWAPPTVYFSQAIAIESVVARARGDINRAIGDITSAARSAGTDIAVTRQQTVSGIVNRARFPRRFAVWTTGIGGLIGLGVAMIGLYGVMAFALAQRKRELGIRSALGAGASDLVSLVMKEGIRATLTGTAIGVEAGLAGVRVLSGPIDTISPTSVPVFLILPLLVTILILTACYIPARRAAASDPLDALRARSE